MRILTGTYRLQFNRDFTFADAEARIGYLVGLGISHVYASPIFAARPGSTHGYDITDPGRINPELGGMNGFRHFVAALREAGLGLIIDIVPNHMAADRANPAWMETLSLGRSAPAARLFDIDWAKPRILLPLLGDELDAVLERGEIALRHDGENGYILAHYFDHAMPLRPASAATLLDHASGSTGEGLDALASAWRTLEAPEPHAAAIEFARDGLRALSPLATKALDAVLRQADLPTLLEEQHWRLSHWRTARDALTHRRFFNITDLVGIRVENPQVFDVTHRLAISLVAEGLVDGLRVDHIDGLADPEAYCRRLRDVVGPDTLIVVEKILEPGEELRHWPIDGTTGYERLNDINGLFVDEGGVRTLDAYLVRRNLLRSSHEVRLAAAKRQVLEETFGSEVDQLVALFEALGAPADTPEFEASTLRQAVIALIAHFPVYRSYGTAHGFSDADLLLWETALDAVSRHEDAGIVAAAETCADRIVVPGPDANPLRVRFQQLSGPAMAKGLEDTEFYRSIGLLSANEVGASPEAPAHTIAAFHEAAAHRLPRHDLVPLATHDTKRGPDTRARLNLLSLDAEGWIAHVERWSDWNRPFLSEVDGASAPDALDQWMIYQTLAGSWPLTRERIAGFITKALREAKRHSRWETPNEAYEGAAIAFATALIDDPAAERFRADFAAFVAVQEPRARVAGIAQTILQLTMPGTPDIYRGSEFWDHAMVDPDNRRPVDWAARAMALSTDMPPPLDRDGVGATKLHVIRRLLGLRRRHPVLFLEGDYAALDLGEAPERWLGFTRSSGPYALVVAVPTRATAPSGDRPAPRIEGLPGGIWQDAFSGREIAIPVNEQLELGRDWPFLVAWR